MNAPGLAHHAAGARIAAALEKCATSVVRIADAQWLLSLTNGAELTVHAGVHDDWLILEGPRVPGFGFRGGHASGEPDAAGLWSLLRVNAALVGGAKCALEPDLSGTQVRAEVPLDDDIDVARRITQACTGIKSAAARVHGSAAYDSPVAAPLTHAELEALCRATPWTCVVRKECVAVDLQVQGAFRALVTARPDGKIAASVDLNGRPADSSSPVCRAALAHFLLRINRVVRMARAAAAGETPRLETVFADAPTAPELNHALAALSVACRMAAREAEVLACEVEAARAYLRLCAPSVPRPVTEGAGEV
jgi:hypothetical protein